MGRFNCPCPGFSSLVRILFIACCLNLIKFCVASRPNKRSFPEIFFLERSSLAEMTLKDWSSTIILFNKSHITYFTVSMSVSCSISEILLNTG